MSELMTKYSFFNFSVGLAFYYVFNKFSDAAGIFLGIKLILNTTLGNALINNKFFTSFVRQKITNDNIMIIIKDFLFFTLGWMVAKSFDNTKN